MPSISEYAGSAGSNYVTAGTTTWSNTADATGSPNGSPYASSSAIGSGTVTQSLDLYNFSPSVPAGNVITGIEFVMTALRGAGTSRLVSIDSCLLTIGGTTGTPTTTNASGTALGTSSATYQFGSSTDLWGFSSGTLSLSNINSATEGTGPTFSVWFIGEGGASVGSADVDAVQLTVTYTTASSGNSGGLTPIFNTSTVLCPIFNTSVGLYDPKSTL